MFITCTYRLRSYKCLNNVCYITSVFEFYQNSQWLHTRRLSDLLSVRRHLCLMHAVKDITFNVR